MEKLRKIDEILVDAIKGLVHLILSVTCLLSYTIVPFIMLAITAGDFINKLWLDGLWHLLLTVFIIYLGRGIVKLLEEIKE